MNPTRPSTPFDVPFYNFPQFSQNRIEVFDGTNYTDLIGTGYINTLGNQYQLRIGITQAPSTNPTAILSMTFRIDTLTQNSLLLENNAFDLSVNQSAYVYADQSIQLTTGVGNLQITTDDNTNSYSWIFGSNADLTLPSAGRILGYDVTVRGTNTVSIKVQNPLNPLATRDWGFSGNGHLTFPNGTTQTTAWTGSVTKSIQTVTTSTPTSITADVVFGDPNAAGGAVNLVLPASPGNGDVVTVKNINAGGNSVYVQTDGILNMETETGTIGSGVYATISTSGAFITWIYESSSTTWRIIG